VEAFRNAEKPHAPIARVVRQLRGILAADLPRSLAVDDDRPRPDRGGGDLGGHDGIRECRIAELVARDHKASGRRSAGLPQDGLVRGTCDDPRLMRTAYRVALPELPRKDEKLGTDLWLETGFCDKRAEPVEKVRHQPRLAQPHR
jgi:hypothetical protein